MKVRWSHRLAGLETHGDGVVATVERLEKESGGYGVAHTEWAVAATQSFRSGFVIGADGHRSLVRRALGTPLDEVGAVAGLRDLRVHWRRARATRSGSCCARTR